MLVRSALRPSCPVGVVCDLVLGYGSYVHVCVGHRLLGSENACACVIYVSGWCNLHKLHVCVVGHVFIWVM